MEQDKITYKDKEYIYGIEKTRDFPERGKTSNVFYIRQKVGYRFLHKYVLIYRQILTPKLLIKLFSKKREEFILEMIDKSILKSRKNKLKILERNAK